MERGSGLRALVTGGAGFIGSHLVERLIARGDDVTVVDDLRTSTRENIAHLGDAARLVQGNCAVAADALADGRFDVVFHLAAPAYVPPSVEDPIGDLRGNVEETLTILQALRRLDPKPRLIHVSSAAIYGEPHVQPILEDTPAAPVSPYGVSKFAAEEHVRVAARLHGIPAAILRYFPTYGPRQRKQVVYDLIRKVCADPTRVEVYGTGKELRDLTYVDDIVAGTIVAADHAPAEGEAYNLGTGSMVTIAQVVGAIARAMRVDPEIVFTGSVRPGDSLRMVADISRLRALGYAPGVRLADGIERTVAWATGLPSNEGAA